MKNLKIKAAAYTINSFVLGLTGGWIIPAEYYKSLSIITAVILLVMFLTDLKASFKKAKPKGKANKVASKRRRPPRRRKRNKRK
uniref:hypothetical protein n=1 Tax=Pseudomonas fluorescens TaxID=294 RepID=UPI00186797A6|nr:hypothetical protein [Pseudomonas fluorescens]